MHHGKNFRGNPVLGSVQNLNRHSFVSGAIGVIALAGLSSSVSAQFAQVSYDLTTGGAVAVNGAVFFHDTSESASGTGVYGAIYKLNTNQAIEEGYNTGITSRMPHVSNSPNELIRLADLTVPANNPISGVSYYSFGLDINEPANAGTGTPLLSMDNVEVWVNGTPLTTGDTYAALASGGAERIYWLDELIDGEVLLDYTLSSSGQGASDMLFLLPQTLFPTTVDGEANYYIYIYSRFGGKGGPWINDGNFEEWQSVAGLSFTFVPEAHTWAAGISLAGLAGAAWMRRRLPGKPVA